MDAVVARAAELGARMNGHPEHGAACVAALTAMLASAGDDPRTTAPVIEALGHARSDPACRAILPLASHEDAGVRLAVAQALHEPDDEVLRGRVVDALIVLCADASAEVREWATFTLSTTIDVDSTAIRSVLADRLEDPIAQVRAEALGGLARRHDSRASDIVRNALRADQAPTLVFTAARRLADPSLLDLLTEWGASRPDDEEIAAAIEACDPVRQHRQQDQTELLGAVQRRLDQHAKGTTAAMWCERLSGEVELRCGPADQVWSVDALLRRAGGDIQGAARLAVGDRGAHIAAE